MRARRAPPSAPHRMSSQIQHPDRHRDASRVDRLRSLVAEQRYEIDEPSLATAVVRRIGPLLMARELPPRRGGRPHVA